MIKFKSNDPAAEIIALIMANNPNVKADSKIAISNIATQAVGKNTSATIIGDGGQGFMGKINVSYDRADLGKIFNQFVEVNKTPTVRIFGNPGSTITLVSILDQLNAKLGTKFTMSGNYPDLADQSIVIPTKGAYVDITVVGKYTAGGFPTSLRVKPGSSLALKISNNGYSITSTVVNKILYPLVKSTGLLNSAQISMSNIAVKRHALFDLKLLDFSLVFLNYLNMFTWSQLATSSDVVWYNTYLSTAVFNAINGKLAENGLPALVNNPPLSTDSNYFQQSGNSYYANSVMVAWANNNATYLTNRIGALNVKTTASIATDPMVNTAFTHVLILSKAKYGMVDTAGVTAGDNYYLHFNL